MREPFILFCIRARWNGTAPNDGPPVHISHTYRDIPAAKRGEAPHIHLISFLLLLSLVRTVIRSSSAYMYIYIYTYRVNNVPFGKL